MSTFNVPPQRRTLKASIAPLSNDPRANTLPWIAAEYVEAAHRKGLKGKALQAFLDQKMKEAGKIVDELPKTSKR